MKKTLILLLTVLALQLQVMSKNSQTEKSAPATVNTIHVAKNGSDSNKGTKDSPLLTISAAAKIAMPGDIILVHEGTYREWVKPERGGTSEDKRIVYLAAPGEKVYIKGSERVTNWKHINGGVWMIEIPSSIFGDYNPYKENISGGFLEHGKWRHRGQVYLNGIGFLEVESVNELGATKYSWQAYPGDSITVMSANFGEGVDPNKELAEINVRESIFMPEVTGLKYITVDGFFISQAATNWTPPSQGLQMGAIGPRLGKYWIIENCDISHAKSTGIVLGGAPGVDYSNIDAYGDHIIRNNHIHHCGQGGLIGLAGATRSIISGNLIEEINYLKEIGGWETAGIKFHHSVDVEISNNIIRGVRSLFSTAGFGIWIDFGNQGIRISGNIIYDNDNYGIHLEMNHGPMLIDNNIVVGNSSVKAKGAEYGQYPGGVNTSTDGVVYAHNLFVDAPHVYSEFTSRSSGYFKPHTTISAGKREGTPREDKWVNNIFIRRGLNNTPLLKYLPVEGTQWALRIEAEDFNGAPGMLCDYNLFMEGAKAGSFGDSHSVVDPFATGFKIESHPNGVSVQFSMNNAYTKVNGPVVNSALAGVITTTGQTIEDKNGKAITVDSDFLGLVFKKPIVGPFSNLKEGLNSVTWNFKERK